MDGVASLAIGLGANLPSPAGDPLATLVAVRPRLSQLLVQWCSGDSGPAQLHWSPLFRTAPVGGPAGQPPYLNAVLLLRAHAVPVCSRAQQLLLALQELERCFARERREHWGPRSLDLDLLWWGSLHCECPHLQLPHPLWAERSFVLEPLRVINQRLLASAQQPLDWTLPERTVAAKTVPPQPLPACSGWPE